MSQLDVRVLAHGPGILRSRRAGWKDLAARTAAALGLALGLAACRSAGASATEGARHERPSALTSARWDDGLAEVSVFAGKVRRYGVWRDAVARDYLVREALSPRDLTKRDRPTEAEIPVLKANRLVSFRTGAYGYELMSSLWFRRADGALVKGRGACLNACGMVTHGWDEPSGRLRADSYWEGEGAASAALPPQGGAWRFADELPFVASALPDGAVVAVRAPLASPRSTLGGPARATRDPRYAAAGLGIGDLCLECQTPGFQTPGFTSPGPGTGAASDVQRAAEHVAPEPLTLTVRRGPRGVVRLVGADGALAAELRYDRDGFLAGWTIPGEQEFRRVRRVRTAYWEETDPRDERRYATR